jgi:hypothetical protein
MGEQIARSGSFTSGFARANPDGRPLSQFGTANRVNRVARRLCQATRRSNLRMPPLGHFIAT